MSESAEAGEDSHAESGGNEDNANYESIDNIVESAEQDTEAKEVIHSKTYQQNYSGYDKVIERIDRIIDSRGEKIVLGEYSENGRVYTLYAYIVGSQNNKNNYGKIGGVISSGAHGDEQGAVEGLIDSLEKIVANKELIENIGPLIVIPVLSPGAYDKGTRENGNGIDINRQFWVYSRDKPPEVALVENFLLSYSGRVKFFCDMHQDDRFSNNIAYALVNHHPKTDKLVARGMKNLIEDGYEMLPYEELDCIRRIGYGIYKKDYDVYSGAFGPAPNSSPSKVFDIVLEINNPAGFSPAVLEILHNINGYHTTQPKIVSIYKDMHKSGKSSYVDMTLKYAA